LRFILNYTQLHPFGTDSEDLIAIRNEMLDEVQEQQASEVFLRTLRELLTHQRVRLANWIWDKDSATHIPVIGKVLSSCGSRPELWQISIILAMEAVQESLRRQGRTPLGITSKTLLDQLRQDGKLLDQNGQKLTASAKGDSVQRVRLDGKRNYCFTINPEELQPPPQAQVPVTRPTKPISNGQVKFPAETVKEVD